jgi:quercetin 2,3-dioxygenase
MKIRRSEDRGHFTFDWLETYHTFSFGDYYDPKHVQFGVLRVINEDRIAPGKGFGAHGHDNMEIITYVIDGVLTHTDSTGKTGSIKPGDVQRMTAGSGIRHSEVNGSDKAPVHLLQIWIFPEQKNLTPGYEQKNFPLPLNQLNLIVSPKGEQGSLKIHQDAKIFACRLKGKKIFYSLAPKRSAWGQVIEGSLVCNGQTLQAGDGAAITEERELTLEGTAHFLLFDLPL